MKESLMKTATKLLENYLGDLQYHADEGVSSCNAMTANTPYFESEDEMKTYLDYVETLISKLRKEV